MMVYADHAATTQLRTAALNALVSASAETWGNPASQHRPGRKARRAMHESREAIAGCLGAEPEEIFFTSGGTESNNWALREGARLAQKSGKRHLIISSIEHNSVINTARRLEKNGFSVSCLKCGPDGAVSTDELLSAIRPDTGLVSVMWANNETGVLQPIPGIANLCHSRGILFHTDAVQAAGHVPIDASCIPFVFLSISAHKFGGPKGIGALYVRRGTDLTPFLEGGGQEHGLRGGTENVPSVISMAAALKESCCNMNAEAAHVSTLRGKLVSGLSAIPGSRVNGSGCLLPGIINISFEDIESESILLRLDSLGIYVSGGSACSAIHGESSHVLRSMGIDERLIRGSVRISLSAGNTAAEIEYMLDIIPKEISRLRSVLR